MVVFDHDEGEQTFHEDSIILKIMTDKNILFLQQYLVFNI